MQVKRREGESGIAYMGRTIAFASASAMVAETLTIPIDTVKVRL